MKEEWDNQGQRQAQQHTQYREMKGEWDSRGKRLLTATCKSIASWVGMMKLAFCSRNDAFTPFRNVQKKS
jgi:hypothetical protein